MRNAIVITALLLAGRLSQFHNPAVIFKADTIDQHQNLLTNQI